MDDIALAAREHENLIEALAFVAANVAGAVVRRSAGVALIATGLPIRLFNQVIVETDAATPTAIGQAVDVTRRRGDRFLVLLRLGADDRFVPLMDDLGLVPNPEEALIPGMALHPLPTERSTDIAAKDPTTLDDRSSGLEIRRITDRAGLDDHIRVGAAGFGMPEALLRTLMGEPLPVDHPVAIYVGYADGRPVTSGLGARTGRTMGIYNIATIPDARQRGFGTAMTDRIALDGRALGSDVAVLQASEMGRPIYERLGYRTVIEYVGYIDPAS
jgi:GNAT superfamily N-acetyltransferase